MSHHCKQKLEADNRLVKNSNRSLHVYISDRWLVSHYVATLVEFIIDIS